MQGIREMHAHGVQLARYGARLVRGVKPSDRRHVKLRQSCSDFNESLAAEGQSEENPLGVIGEAHYGKIFPSSSTTMSTTTDSDAHLALRERPKRSVLASKVPHLTTPRTRPGWVDRQKPKAESIARHSSILFAVSVTHMTMSLLIALSLFFSW